MKQETRTHKG